MGTVAQGGSLTITLAPSKVLTITAGAVSAGAVFPLGDKVGQQGMGRTDIAANGQATFGPYSSSKRYLIVCSEGQLTYGDDDVDPANPVFDSVVSTMFSFPNGVCIMTGADAPVDYTDGSPPATGEGVAEAGSLYLRTNGTHYSNTGTKAEPVWTALATAV